MDETNLPRCRHVLDRPEVAFDDDGEQVRLKGIRDGMYEGDEGRLTNSKQCDVTRMPQAMQRTQEAQGHEEEHEYADPVAPMQHPSRRVHIRGRQYMIQALHDVRHEPFDDDQVAMQ